MLSALCARRTLKKIVQIDGFCFAKATFTSPRTFGFSSAVQRKSSESLIRKSTQDEKKVSNDFQIIYKFPYIRLTRAICKLKLYQTAVTCVAVPLVGYFTHVGTLGPQALISTLSISGLALFMLYVMGEIFRKLIGHLYYNSEKDLVKISHLTFWGGRQDTIVPTEDLVPFSDTTENLTDIYVHVLRYSKPKDSLYMSLKFGGIKDFEKFSIVFGEIQQDKMKLK